MSLLIVVLQLSSVILLTLYLYTFLYTKSLTLYVGYEGQIARDGALGGRWKV
jgi:hypothetical protein